MARPFWPATAEQVVAAVEAVVVNKQPTPVAFVADFADLPEDQAESALNLAIDLGLLSIDNRHFSVDSPLCRFVSTPNEKQKASVLRVVLESYVPFVIFRERLVATNLASTAASQTKTVLKLDSHREAIKDTLISLGTYSHALVTEGGGRYRPEDNPSENTLEVLAQGCMDAAAAEAHIRQQLGEASGTVPREDVISPLADALIRAKACDPRGAVVAAGNAVESFLTLLANQLSVSLTGASGINAKLEKFAAATKLPKKIIFIGKYLGHIRNAADHGSDPEVGSAWSIRKATGIEYTYVACSFIEIAALRAIGKPPEL